MLFFEITCLHSLDICAFKLHNLIWISLQPLLIQFRMFHDGRAVKGTVLVNKQVCYVVIFSWLVFVFFWGIMHFICIYFWKKFIVKGQEASFSHVQGGTSTKSSCPQDLMNKHIYLIPKSEMLYTIDSFIPTMLIVGIVFFALFMRHSFALKESPNFFLPQYSLKWCHSRQYCGGKVVICCMSWLRSSKSCVDNCWMYILHPVCCASRLEVH